MDKHDRSYLKNISLLNPAHLISLGFGSGMMPKAPGTFGSLAALPVCMLLVYTPWYVTAAVALITFFVGWYTSNITEKAMGMHDNSSIVIDEFDGMFISVLFFPQNWYLTILAFILFRIFDVLKPFPISFFDRRVKGGLGVMLDDVIAGIFACSSAHIIFCFVL
ncbi:MAG: phosphatidylglycerophosphatase A [Succinivibrio sp.]